MQKQAITDNEIENCFAVMSALSTHIKQDNFLSMVRHMETEGYKLAYIEQDGVVE